MLWENTPAFVCGNKPAAVYGNAQAVVAEICRQKLFALLLCIIEAQK